MIPKQLMTQVEAHHCFPAGRDGLTVPIVTASGRPRAVAEMTGMIVLRLTPHKA